MEQLTAALMSVGIGAASGLKPYFTVFALGLFGLLVPADAPSFLAVADSHIPATIANPWVLAVCAVLAVIDFVLDKSWLSGAPLELVEETLAVMQGFDPCGVFARDLRECLTLQLKEQDRCDPAMAAR